MRPGDMCACVYVCVLTYFEFRLWFCFFVFFALTLSQQNVRDAPFLARGNMLSLSTRIKKKGKGKNAYPCADGQLGFILVVHPEATVGILIGYILL